jgi:hypothetical protein
MKFHLSFLLLCSSLQNLTLSHLQVLPLHKFMQLGHMMAKKLLLRLNFNKHFNLSWYH